MPDLDQGIVLDEIARAAARGIVAMAAAGLAGDYSQFLAQVQKAVRDAIDHAQVAAATVPANIMRFNSIPGLGMNLHQSGDYVRYDDHVAALAAPAAPQAGDDARLLAAKPCVCSSDEGATCTTQYGPECLYGEVVAWVRSDLIAAGKLLASTCSVHASPRHGYLPLQLATPKPAPQDQLVQDMAMLIKRLAGKIRRMDLETDEPTKALDFLRRHVLAGSPLREGEQP